MTLSCPEAAIGFTSNKKNAIARYMKGGYWPKV